MYKAPTSAASNAKALVMGSDLLLMGKGHKEVLAGTGRKEGARDGELEITGVRPAGAIRKFTSQNSMSTKASRYNISGMSQVPCVIDIRTDDRRQARRAGSYKNESELFQGSGTRTELISPKATVAYIFGSILAVF
jgi:hypothetical protein